MLTGMQASKSVYWSGRSWDSAEAMRTGIVAVTVELFARQACMKSLVVERGMARERKLETMGDMILAPDQRPGRVGAGVEGEVGRRWIASRFGRSGVSGEGMVVVVGREVG